MVVTLDGRSSSPHGSWYVGASRGVKRASEAEAGVQPGLEGSGEDIRRGRGGTQMGRNLERFFFSSVEICGICGCLPPLARPIVALGGSAREPLPPPMPPPYPVRRPREEPRRCRPTP